MTNLWDDGHWNFAQGAQWSSCGKQHENNSPQLLGICIPINVETAVLKSRLLVLEMSARLFPVVVFFFFSVVRILPSRFLDTS